MKTQLVTIETNDIPIDGAFHEPDGETCAAALYFHGNTMNFYVGAPRFLPPVLTAMGYVCLAFNRRGHDILSIRDSRAAEGAAFQLTREGIEDNAIAAAWMAGLGYRDPIVVGHSNCGGVRAAMYNRFSSPRDPFSLSKICCRSIAGLRIRRRSVTQR